MSEAEEKLILGLETGLDGGSVSIIRNGKQIDFAVGQGNVSRSEDLLFLIGKLLENNSLKKTAIGQIVVSDAPGSLTGLRIGQAIAKGLGDSLGAKVQTLPILEALAWCSGLKGKLISVILTENRGIFYREFKVSEEGVFGESQIKYKSVGTEFLKDLESLKDIDDTIFWSGSFENNSGRFIEFEIEKTKAPVKVDGNLAEILGKGAAIKARLIITNNYAES